MATRFAQWLAAHLIGNADDPPVEVPFRRDGLWERALPFAIIAVLAEASLLLPPGPQSATATAISLVLLVGVAGAFFLPWDKLPPWTMVLVPLGYTGSLLALVLAANSTVSGLGLLLLVPIVWTALFHRRWESACVVVAVVAAEIVTALVPVALPDDVVARRAFFWMVLGMVISVGLHDLRRRAHRSQREVTVLHEQQAVQSERDRIAERIRESMMRRIMDATLDLSATASRSTDDEEIVRIETVVQNLDKALVDLRSSVYDDSTSRPSDLGRA